ncbi:MAG: DoxX family protein [Lysobacterales bacterium]
MGWLTNSGVDLWQNLSSRLRAVGDVVPNLFLRLILGWEFFEAGLEKFRGDNWFTEIQSSFPFPFNVVPADFSWQIATWTELAGGVFLWLGLFTRFWAFALLFLTFVATTAVHFPEAFTGWSDLVKGYAVSGDGYGNFKLPLLFAIMFLPLVFNGAGRLSLDHLLSRLLKADVYPKPLFDMTAWGLGALVFGLCFLMLAPFFGYLSGGVLVALAVVLVLAGAKLRA